MSSYKTAAESAQVVRQALKAKGWGTKQVSVRSENYSMGSAVNVSIKDMSVPLDEVERIANGESRIRRCEMSGEILSGGNRHINVSYHYQAENAASALILPAIQALADNATMVLYGFQVRRMGHGYEIIDTVESRVFGGTNWDARETARIVTYNAAAKGRWV